MLTKRLQMAADLIAPGRPVADIGADHGKLAVWLVKNGVSPSAVAADISENALKSALFNVKRADLEGEIEVAVSDGLAEIPPEKADEIVIAGMGGELIAEILSRCEYIKDPRKHLVLQPMTRSEDLRSFLLENRFYIEKEVTASEKSRVYIAMSARYSGEDNAYPVWYPYFGGLAANSGGGGKRFSEKQLLRLEKRYNSIKNIEKHGMEAEKLKNIIYTYRKDMNI
ncbi:MAG: class I SAM-dependent methyltransferase [Oscillospiraceae bacterium]|nr:class I SAM-dependent methyltransferase [Oscillospiraceae bacterium]